MSPNPVRLRFAAVTGLLSVLLGALGAHGHIHQVVTSTGYLDQWQTAVQYHQIHAVALLAIALSGTSSFRGTVAAFLIGILLFSGSLYVLSYTGIRWLGAVTPFGGLSLMLGWLLLAISASKKP